MSKWKADIKSIVEQVCADVATTIISDAWEMLTSFRKPSQIAPGQACRVSALPPKAPPFPMRPLMLTQAECNFHLQKVP